MHRNKKFDLAMPSFQSVVFVEFFVIGFKRLHWKSIFLLESQASKNKFPTLEMFAVFVANYSTPKNL